MRRKLIEILAIVAAIAAFAALTHLADDADQTTPDPDQSQSRIAAWEKGHAKAAVAAAR